MTAKATNPKKKQSKQTQMLLIKNSIKRSKAGVLVHTFIPRAQESGEVDFEDSMDYIVNSKTTRTI